MSEDRARRSTRSTRSNRWGDDDEPGSTPGGLEPPPGMGIGGSGSGGFGGDAMPPPPPGHMSSSASGRSHAFEGITMDVPPPPPPPGHVMTGGGGGGGGSGMPAASSIEAAKAAAMRAAAVIQAQLGMSVMEPGPNVGMVMSAGDGGYGSGPGVAADLSALYPGTPPGWGAGMNDLQLRMAYQQHTRQSRRLYLGAIPPGTKVPELQQFFNDAMLSSGAAVNPGAGAPVMQVTINQDKGFGFVEFGAMEDAESALMFDGITYNGTQLKLSRPKDYIAANNPLIIARGGMGGGGGEQGGGVGGQPMLGMVGGGGMLTVADEMKLHPPPALVSEWVRLPRRTPDGPFKLYAGGFDPLHTEWQVRQLLQAVGPLQSFAVMPDEVGKSTGHAFFEYVDPRLTAIAEQAITGIVLLQKRLVCKRAMPDAEPEVPGSGALATYRVPLAALPLLEAPSCTLAVYNAVVDEHDAVAAAEVEAAVAREGAAAAKWDPASVSSRRGHADGRITLAFAEGGGGWSGVRGSALEAAVRCAINFNGRAFEGRQLWVRYAPTEGVEAQVYGGLLGPGAAVAV